jgi:hypothetical protein
MSDSDIKGPYRVWVRVRRSGGADVVDQLVADGGRQSHIRAFPTPRNDCGTWREYVRADLAITGQTMECRSVAREIERYIDTLIQDGAEYTDPDIEALNKCREHFANTDCGSVDGGEG